MRRHLSSLFLLLATVAVAPLAAQDDEPHVYRVLCIQVLDTEYINYLQEILIPMYDEGVRMGSIVSYHAMRQLSGAGECDLVTVAEYPRWDVIDDFTPAVFDEASQAVHGKPWAEVIAAYDLPALRKIIRTEYYSTLRP